MPVFVIQDPDVKEDGKKCKKSGYLPFFRYYPRKLPKQDAALADLCPLPKYRASAVVLPINPQYVFDLFLLYLFRSHDAIISLDASYASDEMVGCRDVRNFVGSGERGGNVQRTSRGEEEEDFQQVWSPSHHILLSK